MSNHGMRQQKKLAKQKAKRTEKKTQLGRQNSTNPAIRLAGSDAWPIVSVLVPSSLWSNGIGNLFIARRMPNGSLAVGCFLVDAYCLGVKDASWMIKTDGQYQEIVERAEGAGGKMDSVKPEYFAKLIWDAVDYAAASGLPPHADFRLTSLLLSGIDRSLCDTKFEFGLDGKPYFVQGPHDSPERVRLIMSRITQVGGNWTLAVGEDSPYAKAIDLAESDADVDFDDESDESEEPE
jgi:hypothetical protein